MKASSILSLVAVAGFAAAQLPDNIPACTKPCLNKYLSGSQIAGCNQFDIGCVCRNQDFISGVACCLEKSCDKAGQNSAIQYAKEICATAGVTTPDSIEGVCKTDPSPSSSAPGASESSSSVPPASKSESGSSPSKTAGTQTTAETSGASKTDSPPAAKTSTKANSANGLTAAGGVIGGLLAMAMAL